MKTIMTAVAAAMLFASPIVAADSADARHRDKSWVKYHSHHWKPHRKHHHKVVRKRHHRWVHRGGIVIKIVVYPGYPYYSGCGGYCW